MAVTPGSSSGNLNSTTEVELVAAPGAGIQRGITLANIYNKDTVNAEYTLSKKVAGVLFEVKKEILATGVTGKPVSRDNPVYLTGTDQSLVAVLTAIITTNQPRFVCSWVDKSTVAASIADDVNIIAGHRAFFPHPPAIPEPQAGTNITIVRNALGHVISSTGGGAAVDDAGNILANQVFGK